MRTTPIHTPTRRHPVSRSLAAFAVAIAAACGGGDRDDTTQSAQTPPVTPVVAVSESSGTASGTVRVDYSNVSYETAESTYMQGQYREASEMFDAYVQRKPDNPWGHYMLGLSAWKAGELARAEAALTRSHELDPSHVKTLLNLGRVLLDQDRAGEAKERVQAALAIDSTSGEVYRMLGRVHTALGEPDEAVEAYRTALAIDPTEVWSMNNLGLIHMQQEQFEDALGPLARAVQLRPGSPVFQNNLGIALERTGHVGQAREAFRAALAADSTYRKAQVSLTRVEGLEDDAATVPVELSVLADAFEREVQGWREARAPAPLPVGIAVTPDSVTTPER